MTSTLDRLALETVPRDYGLRRAMRCAVAAFVCAGGLWAAASESQAANAWQQAIANAEPKVVKVYGAGGLRRLEAYQTGIVISPDGEILTTLSYVIDTDAPVIVLSDGRRFTAEWLAADPAQELALLKIDAQGLDYFDLTTHVPTRQIQAGTRVLALSNLFGVATGDEDVSVQRGVISAVSPLETRRGTFSLPFTGEVLLLDCMTNNPGATGGAVVDGQARLLGLVGREVREATHGAWLNFAWPVERLYQAVGRMRADPTRRTSREASVATTAAEPWSLELIGIVLIPDVVERTPPYVDALRRGAPAAAVGLQVDDLIATLNGRLVPTCKALLAELMKHDRQLPLELGIMRHAQYHTLTIPPLATAP